MSVYRRARRNPSWPMSSKPHKSYARRPNIKYTTIILVIIIQPELDYL